MALRPQQDVGIEASQGQIRRVADAHDIDGIHASRIVLL
jgi:hypothetical protein